MNLMMLEIKVRLHLIKVQQGMYHELSTNNLYYNWYGKYISPKKKRQELVEFKIVITNHPIES